MDVFAKMKARREELYFSQEYVAAMLNITQATYSRMESGFIQPSADRLLKLSQILEVSVIYFFEDKKQA